MRVLCVTCTQAAFEMLICPILTAYAPDVIIVAAGFDAAEGDPLGQCKVRPRHDMGHWLPCRL